MLRHPCCGSQVSSVQSFESLQSTIPAPGQPVNSSGVRQDPLTHASPVVQALSSAQFIPSFAGDRAHVPLDGTHMASSQMDVEELSHSTILAGSTSQTLLEQTSVPLHALSSSKDKQSASEVHAQVLSPLTQPPSTQVSPSVQGLPSSQMVSKFSKEHPVSGSQVPITQGLLSPPQSSMAVGTQSPNLQRPPSVHRSPSSQGSSLSLFTASH